MLCRCEHNTCGDECNRCCAGFEQKPWRRARSGDVFQCEQCNCHGHTAECVYDAQLDADHKSMDIHGEYEGGGRCVNCGDHTEGVNCEKCAPGYFNPTGTPMNVTNACTGECDIG